MRFTLFPPLLRIYLTNAAEILHEVSYDNVLRNMRDCVSIIIRHKLGMHIFFFIICFYKKKFLPKYLF